MRDLFVEGVLAGLRLDGPGESGLFDQRMLHFPEIRTLARGDKKDVIASIAEQILAHEPPDELPRRLPVAEEIGSSEIRVDLGPPSGSALWSEPLSLTFPYLFWDKESLAVAFVPALDIEVVSREAQSLELALEEQILATLARWRIRHDLFEIALLQRHRELVMERFLWNIYPLSPKERHVRDEGDEEATTRVLAEIAEVIEPDSSEATQAIERSGETRRLARILARPRSAGSVLLVGEPGVGKSHIARHVATRKNQLGLAGRSFYRTSGSRIIAGMTGFGEWQERCQAMIREAGEQNAILLFGNLLELMNVGQYSGNSESVASFFRPALVRGDLVAVAECTPAELAVIEQRDPRILEAFRQVRIEPPDEEAAFAMARSVSRLPYRGRGNPPDLDDTGIRRALALHRRYAGYSALPGRLIRFLDRLRQRGGTESIRPDQIDSAFIAETGLPPFLLDENAPFDTEAIESWFRKRVIGQDGAIAPVVDTIAGIRARLTRPGKPLGSFLFIGPTGVGKTELARTLAEFFYGSRERMIRLDMSEYAAPGSGTRLIAASSTDSEGLLTARLRDEPFSLVLLDEFEKADDSVYDLFLQVLGEARLTDGAGRLADFSNALIVLTSNLGAADYRAGATGFHDPTRSPGGHAREHFTEAVKKRFRPEFFNRIDRIIPFLPLGEDPVRLIVQREVSGLDRRDGFRARELALVADDMAGELGAAGYDPRYGARPLKRAIEDRLIRPLGQFLAAHPAVRKGLLVVRPAPEGGEPEIVFEGSGETSGDASGEVRSRETLSVVSGVRRLYQTLAGCSLFSELQSERLRLQRQSEIRSLAATMLPEDFARLTRLTGLVSQVERDHERSLQAEERLILAMIGDVSHDTVSDAIADAPAPEEATATLVEIFAAMRNPAPRAVLVLTADSSAHLFAMAGLYRDAGCEAGLRPLAGFYRRTPRPEERHPSDSDRWLPALCTTDEEWEELVEGRLGGVAAIALEYPGERGALLLEKEAGLHVVIDENGNRRNLIVDVHCDAEFTIQQGYLSGRTLLRRDYTQLPVRRQWETAPDSEKMKDTILGSSLRSPFPPGHLSPATLARLWQLTLDRRVLAALDS